MRRIVFWTMLALLLLGTFALAFNVGLVHALPLETVYINGDGSVSPSDAPISSVDNVTYTLTGNISTALPPTFYFGIVVERNNTIFDGNGYTVQGSYSVDMEFWLAGITLSDTSNVTIEDANIQGFYDGIRLVNSSNNVINWNNLTGNFDDGIHTQDSGNNTISGNNITRNVSYGIVVFGDSNNNVIRGNNVEGILLDLGCSNNIVSGNNEKPEGFSTYLYLSDSSNNTVSGNNATIYLFGSSNNIVSGNDATAFDLGAGTYPDYGICLDNDSNNNTISGNNVTANTHGDIYESCIMFQSSSNNNTVSGNNVTANSGLSIELTDSSNNTIYHNNFVGKIVQASVDSASVGDSWDNGYPSGGNYWSNYNGTDLYSGSYQNVTGSDGIGDTPYIVDTNNTDHYPLMGGFSDFSVAPGADVQVISNSTVSDFQFNGNALLFNVSGVNGTTGFCNICIQTALLNGTLSVFVNGTRVQYNLLPISNSSISYLYFTYGHSTEQVIIMPEFPDSLILAMFMLAALLAIATYKKEHEGS